MSDALKNQVAFQVAVEIVDEFEAVEVHEDQGKGTARTRRALPFGGKRLHEEPVRLHAGETVGDGLFLRLLERRRVVQRAGDQVCEGAQEQILLLRRNPRDRGFDIQDAVELLGVENGQSDGRERIWQERLEAKRRRDCAAL